MFRIVNCIVTEKKLNYEYVYDSKISKYFKTNEKLYVKYDKDITNVPQSILVIPLLANVVTISWFAGFDIEVNELDEDFFNSLNKIKAEFEKNYPQVKNNNSKIKYNKLVKNDYNVAQSAMLFSGGVDAFTTYFRHVDECLDLITIHGADLKTDDSEQWNNLKAIISTEELIAFNKKLFLESNIRTFYTYHVDLLLPNLGWWGKVQHGLALNCLLAPLAYINSYKKIYIASSYTENVEISWGSMPQIDNQIRWGNTVIIHDGYELQRQEKVETIVSEVNKKKSHLNLHVCYSEVDKKNNCGKCEKCLRTIVGVILANGNPNNLGFNNIDEKIYDLVLKEFANGFSTKGVQYFWWEINQKIKKQDDFYVFSDKSIEKKQLETISKLIDDNYRTDFDSNPPKTNRRKHVLINSFPTLFKYYLKIRRTF